MLNAIAACVRATVDSRPCEMVVKVDGAKANRKRLVGTFNLAAHASYDRVSTRITVPLTHGAGTLQACLPCTGLSGYACARVRHIRPLLRSARRRRHR